MEAPTFCEWTEDAPGAPNVMTVSSEEEVKCGPAGAGLLIVTFT